MTPSQARIHQAAEEAAVRRRRREIEQEVRQWYRADFQIVYEAVARTKMNQSRPSKAVSHVLYESILAAHQAKLEALEEQIEKEIDKRLAKKSKK